jgi:hypothetical protein
VEFNATLNNISVLLVEETREHKGEVKAWQGDFQQLHRDMFSQKCVIVLSTCQFLSLAAFFMEIAEGNEHFDVNSFISYRFQGESNKILNQQI